MRRILIGMLLASALATAQSHWTVSGRLLGKGGKPARDISGIACVPGGEFPRAGLLVDDETDCAQFITLREGVIEAGNRQALNDDGQEFDGEGVAFYQGFYYVIGSHGHPRDAKGKLDPVHDAEKIRQSIVACSKIVRIPAGGGKIEVSTRVRDMLASQPQLTPYFDRRLDQNGLTVEGLAIVQQDLYVALRGPSLPGGQAVMVSAPLAALFDRKKELSVRLHLLSLGAGRGLRDIVPYGDGLLLLCGPTGEQEAIYSLAYWQAGRLEPLLELPPYRDERGLLVSPEAILPLPAGSGSLRLLVWSDGAPVPQEVSLVDPIGRDRK